MATLTVREARERRHRRVRRRIVGTAERPRLTVFRSNRGIEAQLIDDVDGKTLAHASHTALAKSFKGSKSEQAAAVGKELAATAKKAAASISTVRQPSATRRSTFPRVSRYRASVVHVAPSTYGTSCFCRVTRIASTAAGDGATVRLCAR